LGSGVFASDQDTLTPTLFYGFTTTHAVGGLNFSNSTLYYGENNIIYRRDPLTAQTLVQSTPLPDIFGALAIGPQILGDVNLDGHVNVADIQALMVALSDLHGYEAHNSLNDADLLSIADIDRNGTVNNADIQALITLVANNTVIVSGGPLPGSTLGGGEPGAASTPPVTAVPEPASIVLLTFGALAIALRRYTVFK
jgi:hypothetical protein